MFWDPWFCLGSEALDVLTLRMVTGSVMTSWEEVRGVRNFEIPWDLRVGLGSAVFWALGMSWEKKEHGNRKVAGYREKQQTK